MLEFSKIINKIFRIVENLSINFLFEEILEIFSFSFFSFLGETFFF
jgi:hypothetical protein